MCLCIAGYYDTFVPPASPTNINKNTVVLRATQVGFLKSNNLCARERAERNNNDNSTRIHNYYDVRFPTDRWPVQRFFLWKNWKISISISILEWNSHTYIDCSIGNRSIDWPLCEILIVNLYLPIRHFRFRSFHSIPNCSSRSLNSMKFECALNWRRQIHPTNVKRFRFILVYRTKATAKLWWYVLGQYIRRAIVIVSWTCVIDVIPCVSVCECVCGATT